MSSEESDVIDRLVEDARAEGYAQGRRDQAEAGKVRLAMMSDELRMMPEVLVDAYAALCAEALRDGTEGRREDSSPRVKGKPLGWRISSNQTETRAGAKTSGKKGPVGGPEIKSRRMFVLKEKIDRKLRKLAREIESRMAGGTGEMSRKCSRCGKYGEPDWIWCPWDGAAMQSEDHNASR